MSTSSLVPSLLLRHVLLSRKFSARLSPPLFTECISANESHLLPDGCVSFQISLYLGQGFSRGFLFPTPSFFYLRSSRNRPVCTSFSFLLMFFHVLFILFSYPFQTLLKPFLYTFHNLFISFDIISIYSIFEVSFRLLLTMSRRRRKPGKHANNRITLKHLYRLQCKL